jgi:hypothetical protein
VQDLRADLHVGDRVKRGQVTPVLDEALGVDPGHYLHQALCADRALGERIQPGLDRDDRQDQQRVELLFPADVEGVGDEHPCRLVGDAVAPGEVLDEVPLPRVDGDRPRRRGCGGTGVDFDWLRFGRRNEGQCRRHQLDELVTRGFVAGDGCHRQQSGAAAERDHQADGRHGAVAHVAQEVEPAEASGPRDPQRIIRGL